MTWFQLLFHTPVNKTSIESEILWINSHIRIQNAPVCYKTWFEKDIIRIKDIFNQNGTLHTVEYFRQKLTETLTSWMYMVWYQLFHTTGDKH